jgi:hypothetical protein
MVEEVASDDAGVMYFKDLCLVIRDKDFEVVTG